MNDPLLVCMRQMKLKADGADTNVVVRIWQPKEVPVEGADHSVYRCEFEIAGLPQPVRAHAHGADSMHALVSALTGVNHHRRPYSDALSWLDNPYDEWALYIHVEDAGRRRRIQDILDEEEYAIERRLLSLERTKEERNAHLASRAANKD